MKYAGILVLVIVLLNLSTTMAGTSNFYRVIGSANSEDAAWVLSVMAKYPEMTQRINFLQYTPVEVIRQRAGIGDAAAELNEQGVAILHMGVQNGRLAFTRDRAGEELIVHELCHFERFASGDIEHSAAFNQCLIRYDFSPYLQR